jgi:mitochondrial fission process protein 1
MTKPSESRSPSELAHAAHQDIALVLSVYDTNNDGILSDDELRKIKEDFKNKSGPGYDVIQRRYASKSQQLTSASEGVLGELSDEIIQRIKEDANTAGTAMRYLALVGAFARAIKYLRVIFRPFANPNIIRASFVITWSYIFSDVGYHTYNMKRHGSVDGNALFLAAAKRLAFHSVASVVLPAYTVPTVVDLARRVVSQHRSFAHRHPSFRTFLPPICGLAVLPTLPLLYDRPVGALCDWVFDDAIIHHAKM